MVLRLRRQLHAVKSAPQLCRRSLAAVAANSTTPFCTRASTVQPRHDTSWVAWWRTPYNGAGCGGMVHWNGAINQASGAFCCANEQPGSAADQLLIRSTCSQPFATWKAPSRYVSAASCCIVHVLCVSCNPLHWKAVYYACASHSC
jgi:hypothetical protein